MELRRTDKPVIEGLTYEITQLGAIQGSKVFVRVLKLLGPALLGKGDMTAFFGALKEEDLEYLCNVFSPMTMVQGVGPLDKVFDAHFVGRYKAMLIWLGHCLQINYGDFLKGKDLGAVLGATVAVQSNAPTQSSGAS